MPGKSGLKNQLFKNFGLGLEFRATVHPHTEAGQFGKVEYEAQQKTSCRIVMIVVILIAEGFRQAGELENFKVAFGNEKKKCGFSKPDHRPLPKITSC